VKTGQRAAGQTIAGARHQALVFEQRDDPGRALQDFHRLDDDEL